MSSDESIDAIVQEIEINASAVRIFEALTSPDERLKWWWSSAGRFEITHVESDLRPGGKFVMRGTAMGDKTVTISGEYREIDPPHVLAFTWLPDWQAGMTETLVRWDLEEQNGVTTVRLTHSGFADANARAVFRGWPAILSSLQAYVTENPAAEAAK